MKKIALFALAMVWAGTALAGEDGSTVVVPEIEVLAGLSAIALIGAAAALIWERRRK